MVRRNPSIRGTFGSQPSNSRALRMSGFRRCGSSTGKGCRAISEDDTVRCRTLDTRSLTVISCGLPRLTGPGCAPRDRVSRTRERERGVKGKGVTVRVDHDGRGRIKKKKNWNKHTRTQLTTKRYL